MEWTAVLSDQAIGIALFVTSVHCSVQQVHLFCSPSPEFLETGSFTVLTAVSPVANASCDASALQGTKTYMNTESDRDVDIERIRDDKSERDIGAHSRTQRNRQTDRVKYDLNSQRNSG